MGGWGGTYMFAELIVVCVLHLFRLEYQPLDLKLKLKNKLKSENKEENEE